METETKPTSTNRVVLRYFWKAFWRYRGTGSLVVLTIIVSIVADTVAPWFQKAIIDGISTLTPGESAVQVIAPSLIWLGVFWGISWICWRIAGLVIVIMQPKAMKDLQDMSFEYMLGHSYQFYSDAFTGSLVRKVTRFSQSFMGVMDEMVFRFIPVAIILCATLVALAIRAPKLAVIFVVWTVLFFGMNIVATRWKLKADLKRAELDSKVTGSLSDALTNAVTIKLFTKGKEESRGFRALMEQWRRAQTDAWRRGEVSMAVQGFLMTGVNLLIMVVGVQLWSEGKMTVGDFVLVQSYIAMVFGRLWDIGRAFRRVYECMADAREMTDILETPYAVADKPRARALTIEHGEIAFKHVTFSFHQTRKVLNDFSLNVAPREKVALVGPSGAGKSTVTKLLFRFHDLDAGKILIDGQDIADVTQESLRKHIALVPQEPILFHRTLRENIAYGRVGATEREVIAAAKKAHCHEFISELPDKYESFVGERGIKLSGGERQRIAIARAIVKNAPILVLDEATSSLDSESEQYIQEALRMLMQDKTVIVIAHRLSTIMLMDRIIVVENGRAVDTGTHTELLKKQGVYKRLWDIQAGGFVG